MAIIKMIEKTKLKMDPKKEKLVENKVYLSDKEKKMFDLNYKYETGSGRVIIDPVEAEVELGRSLASHLKLDKTGQVVLWPQPNDDPEDPQNWSESRKLKTLIVLTMATFVPDFDSAIGVACLFPLAEEYHTTPGKINDVSSNWSILLIGVGGIPAIVLAKRYGRLPVLFWSQVLGLIFLIGCTLAPNLSTFAAMRCLNALFSAAPQATGIFAITDMYSFHLQAKMINFWSAGYLASPYVSPWLFGYLVAKLNYRWAYAIGCFYGFIVVALIAFFAEETAYNRYQPWKPSKGVNVNVMSKFKTLIGVAGFKLSAQTCSWKQATLPILRLLLQPHCIVLLIYVGVVFGFAIGINVTNVVFTSSPPPLGYGLSQNIVASLYATPVVAVFIGEMAGRFLNDKVASFLTSRNRGVFEPEMRLRTLYAGFPLNVAGFIALGGAFEHRWGIVAIVFGWGMAEVGTMVTTVASLNYLNDSFFFPGEIAALLNLVRTLGGFAVPYFQVEWASKKGALHTFGCEAAIMAGCFIIFVPFVQIKGPRMRSKCRLKPQVHNYSKP